MTGGQAQQLLQHGNGPAGPSPVTAQAEVRRRQSDQRFRSFAERYLIARATFLRPSHELEDGWKVLLDAKSLYAMIRRTGENIDPDDAT